MKKFWYFSVAAAVGAASLGVWGQANAGPPSEVTPGVVVTAGSGTGKTQNPAALVPAPTPTATITATPAHAALGTQLVPAKQQTYTPVPTVSASHQAGDDKGGLRGPGVSDDAPGDDKGGLRDDNIPDDAPGDDKGGRR
jgi:hypothetical protein